MSLNAGRRGADFANFPGVAATRLDLGCGTRPKEGFTGVDIRGWQGGDPSVIIAWDLADGSRPWPFDDEQIEELYCSHMIEHIEARDTWVERRGVLQDSLFYFFDQAYRVAKPGATFTLLWPALEGSAESLQELGGRPLVMPGPVFQDPTHRRYLSRAFLNYLSVEGRRGLGVEQYEIRCDWRTLRCALLVDPDRVPLQYQALLQKPDAVVAKKATGS